MDFDGLGKALRENTTLEEIDISYNKLEDRNVDDLIYGLRRNTSVKILRLSDNYINDRGGRALLRMLEKEENITLIELDLENKYTGNIFYGANKVESSTISKIKTCLERNRTRAVEEFLERIRNNKLEEEEVDAAGTLRVPYLKLTASDIKAIFEALSENPHITGLSFGINNINNHPRALAEGIKNNKTLQFLDLSNKKLDSDSAGRIVEALEHNTTLKTLDLSNSTYTKTVISGDTAREITVNYLFESEKNILTVLRTYGNTTLTEINLSNNKITVDADNEVKSYLARNRKMAKEQKQAEQMLGELNTLKEKLQVAEEESGAKLKREVKALEKKRDKKLQAVRKDYTTKIQTAQKENKTNLEQEVENLEKERDKKLEKIKKDYNEQIQTVEIKNETRLEKEIKTLKTEREAEAEIAKIKRTELEKVIVDIWIVQKERIGQFDNEFYMLKAQSKILKEDLEEQLRKASDEQLLQCLKEIQPHWNIIQHEVKYFFNTHDGDKTKIEESLEEIRQKVYEMDAIMKQHNQKFISLSDSDEFIKRNKQTLHAMAYQHEHKAFKNRELSIALKTNPQARVYHRTLVTSFNRLYMASAVADTKYFNPKTTGAAKGFKGLLNLTGKLVPAFGGYFDVAANVVEAIGLHYTKKNLKNFVNIAVSAEEMDKIIQQVAYELVIANKNTPKNMNRFMAENHLKLMIAAIFSGELNKLEGLEHETSDRKVEIVADALLNIIEDKEIHVARAKAHSPMVIPQNRRTKGSFKSKLNIRLKRNREANASDEEEKALTPIEKQKQLNQETRALLGELKQAFPPEKRDVLVTLAESMLWSLEVTEKQQEKRLNELPGGGFSSFLTAKNGNATRLGTKQGFCKPRSRDEKDIKRDINTRLTDIYDGLFEDIKVRSRKDKRKIRDRLRTIILDKVLRDVRAKEYTFKTAFLESDIDSVADHLETIIKEELTAAVYPKIDDHFAKRVVNKLATALTPSNTQTLTSQSRRKRSSIAAK